MSTVRGAVEKRQQDATPDIRTQIDQHKAIIGKLLDGTGTNVEQFKAQIGNAFRAQPDLWQCQPATVLGAFLRAAQLGLAPNDDRGYCYVLPYGGKASFQMGYRGFLELAQRANPGVHFDGREVYPNDVFQVDYGSASPLRHEPAITRGMDRGGDAYAWYVRAMYPDGHTTIVVLDREKVEYHRSFSKQPNGQMWTKSYDAAALKSCVTDLKRWLRLDNKLSAAFASDGAVIDVQSATPIEQVRATYDATATDEAQADDERPFEEGE